ncbi:cytochrome c [Rhizobium sp. L1K21]|uniref:c-type cytochrome n=1 Tax=Rhizobium sp. L1K21 TaxID=2954933 RepID=UPI002092160C|nr:cytochrome c [Rhizobium sp. L1K21]MCO6187784.1 cytochrome c [Rhizobium sp. L1K21]
MRRYLTMLFALLALSACDEMNQQPRYDSYEESPLFRDGKSLQSAPPGTVSRNARADAEALLNRPPMTSALLERGRERFEIYCRPCHDASGYGNGTVPARGFPKPPSFHSARLRLAGPAYFVSVITDGHGVMYSYADRVAPADRWAIAAYILALQRSQSATLDALTAAERQKLAKGGS